MCWGQVLIFDYFSARCSPPIILKHLWCKSYKMAAINSSLNDISLERNFENQFQIWWSVMTFWLLTLEIFSSVSLVGFFFHVLNFPQQMSVCSFISSILEGGDHRLNYDAHSFTNENKNDRWKPSLIRYLHLKHWKYKMRSYNILLKNGNYLRFSPL